MAASSGSTGTSAPKGRTRSSLRIASQETKSYSQHHDSSASSEEESASIDEDPRNETDAHKQRDGEHSSDAEDNATAQHKVKAASVFRSLTKQSKGAVLRRITAEAEHTSVAAPNPDPETGFVIHLNRKSAKKLREASNATSELQVMQKSPVWYEDLDRYPANTDQKAIVKRLCQAILDTDAAIDGPVGEGTIFGPSSQWQRFRKQDLDMRNVEAHMWKLLEVASNLHTVGAYPFEKDKGKKLGRPEGGCEALKFQERISAIENLLKHCKLVWPDIVAGGTKLQALVQMPEYVGHLKAAYQQNNRIKKIGKNAHKSDIWKHIKTQAEENHVLDASAGDNEEGGMNAEKPDTGSKDVPAQDKAYQEGTTSSVTGSASKSGAAEITARYVDSNGKASIAKITEERLERLKGLNRIDSPHESLAEFLRREHGSNRIEGLEITQEAIEAEIEDLKYQLKML